MLQVLQHKIQEFPHPAPLNVKYTAVVPEEPYSLTGISNNLPTIKGDWGACYKCGCKQFKGSFNYCSNSACGHAFIDHGPA